MSIELLPFGDVHYGSVTHAKDHFDSWYKATTEMTNPQYIGMGDYFDTYSTTERALHVQMHGNSQQDKDDQMQALIEKFVAQVKHMKGRCLGLLEGNHYYRFCDGTSSTQRLARLLDAPYLGCLAFICLTVDIGGKHQHRFDIYAHHGKGAARLLGGSLNTVQQMAEAAEADLYLMGHDHKLISGKAGRFFVNRNGNIDTRCPIYLRTGSFQKGFIEGRSTFAANRAMNPTTLGAPHIVLTTYRTRLSDGRVQTNIDAKAVI